jgi:endogenous inhibitor of DNA gyrase (YacG/DUF329 family)
MRCPSCKREFDPAASAAKPFCSERCRLVDLGRWLGEGYSLPLPSQADDEEELEGRRPAESDGDG